MLPRCENCYAYFNTYCELEQWAWTCSFCGTLNGLSSEVIARYSHPRSCAEMVSSFIDVELPLEGSEEEMMQAQPVYVAAVDLSSVSLVFPVSLPSLKTSPEVCSDA